MELVRVILKIYIAHFNSSIKLTKFILKIPYLLLGLFVWPLRAMFRLIQKRLRANAAPQLNPPNFEFSATTDIVRNLSSQSSHSSLIQQQFDRFRRENQKQSQ